MASNTLIAYPIVSRFGLQQKPSVTLSVGSSMLSLLIALIMLAGLVASFSKHDGVLFWLFFAAKFAAYCGVMIFLIPRLTRWFLRRYSDSVMQFIFVMAMLFMSAALSQMVGIEGVFGAFFAGLILNRYIPHVSPLMNRLEFTGNALFIPYFLIGVEEGDEAGEQTIDDEPQLVFLHAFHVHLQGCCIIPSRLPSC